MAKLAGSNFGANGRTPICGRATQPVRPACPAIRFVQSIAAFAVFLALLAVAPRTAWSQDDETSEKGEEIRGEECAALLEKIADTTEANFKSLKSWSATWTGELRIRLPPNQSDVPAYGVEHVKWKTVVDLTAAKVFCDFDTTAEMEVIEIESGARKPTGRHGRKRTSVLTTEHFLFCDAQSRLTTVAGFPEIKDPHLFVKGRSVFRRTPQAFPTEDAWRVIDPRTFFRSKGRPIFFWEFIRKVADSVRSPDDKSQMHERVSIRKSSRANGDVFFLSIIFRRADAPDGVTEIEFDSRVGMNRTSWKDIPVIGKGFAEATTYEWRLVDGVFVPTRMSDSFFGNKGTEEPSASVVETLTAAEVAVNAPTDPGTFEMSAFQLRYGDRVYDEIERRLSVYDDKKLVPIDEFAVDPGRFAVPAGTDEAKLREPRRAGPWLFVVLNLMAIGIIAAVLWRKRNRKRAP